jgi:diguanylate cyclase (GGDEF)-like protein
MSHLPRSWFGRRHLELLPPLVTEDAERSDAAGPERDEARTPEATEALAIIARLWADVKPAMLERVGTIEYTALALLEGNLEGETRREAEREAHKLAGAAGSFGFAAASRMAREIELLLNGTATIDHTDALRLADLTVALRRELEGEPGGAQAETADPVTESDAERLKLLVVCVDTDLSAGLGAEAAARGLQIDIVADAPAVQAAVATGDPAAVLIDLAESDSVEIISELKERLPKTPLLVLTERVTFADRVEIARRGARYLLPRPQTPRKLIEAVLQATPAPTVAEATVLVVDDDPQMLSLLDAILRPAGLHLTLIDSPARFWETFEENPPDLIVLDFDMPDVSGLDLCRIVRNDPRWDHLPILFLTARTDPTIIQQLFAAGADDYVAKPVIAPEILTRIVNRLERARLQRTMAECDPLTGLANRYKAELVFDQFFRLAERQGVPVALAILDVDRFKGINDQYGHAIADQVLQYLGQLLLQRFRGYDVAARWGGEEFVIGMFGVDRDFARQRLIEILDAFQKEEFVDSGGTHFSVTFSAGVTEYPADGTTLQDLYRAADAALYQAKAAGRARVFPSTWGIDPEHVARKVDVALVEDDNTLASLLLHTLATRGYQTEWFKDGEAAANALTGSRPDVQARVVLLDVGLPGTDGFDVLRRMVGSNVTRRTRVIMLTAHATENEVLTALELGAFDHVAKPFSAPVLLQRIRRAMTN